VTVHLDMPDGASVKRTREGWEAVRIARIDGLTGDADAILYNAATATGMPAYGSMHPTVPNIYLYEIHPRAIGACQAEVRLVYKPPRYTPTSGQKPRITVSASMQQDLTDRDINGTPHVVGYSTEDDQRPEVSVFRPKPTIRFTRMESSSPSSLIETYAGCVNQAGWNIRPSATARTWLCTDITGQSDDGGDTYEVTYEFMHCGYSPTGNWDSYLVWKQGATGRAPTDIVDGVGRVVYQHYWEANFNALALDD